MSEVISKVCDICKGEEAEAYVITSPEGTLNVDLCSTHGAVLGTIRGEVSESLFTPKGGRRPRRSRIVVDPSAI